jgi:2-oxo-4-hydroxy-4-carboxy-5-ureidoimidazoline decarboxylase
VDAALSGHPRIGERAPSLDGDAAARSAREQAGMAAAGDRLRQAMASGNADYEARFGRIYLVAAAGRSAEDLLALLRQRLANDPATELDVVRRELARITRLRLADTFGGDHT